MVQDIEGQEPIDLTPDERETLEKEYEQLCHDWRLRDQYVLMKLIPSSVVFGSAVIGYSQTQNFPLLKVILLFFCTLLLFVIIVSVIKDIYFNWGTQKVAEAVSARLNIKQTLSALNIDLNLRQNQRQTENFKFSRKAHLSIAAFVNEQFPGITRPFIRILAGIGAFKLIISFYLILFTASLFLLILSILEWSKC